jgi:hypothetical protein
MSIKVNDVVKNRLPWEEEEEKYFVLTGRNNSMFCFRFYNGHS